MSWVGNTVYLFLTFLLSLFFSFCIPLTDERFYSIWSNSIYGVYLGHILRLALPASAGLCALLGAFELGRSPRSPAPSLIAFWVLVYLLLWSERVHSIHQNSRSFEWPYSFFLGALFIFLFLRILALQVPEEEERAVPTPGYLWVKGARCFWAVFLLVFALELAMTALSSTRILSALGALLLGYLSLLFFLRMHQDQGGGRLRIAQIGRWVYGIVFMGTILYGVILKCSNL